MMVPTNTEILPENFCDPQTGEINPGAETTVKGAKVDTSDLLDGVPGLNKCSASLDDNELSLLCFQEAQAEYKALDNAAKKNTSPGTISMRIFSERKAEHARQAALETKSVSRPLKSKMIAPASKESTEMAVTTKAPKRVVRKKKVVKRVKTNPTQPESLGTASPEPTHSNITVRKAAPAPVPVDPFSGLQIPQLGLEPVYMDIEAGISWEAGESTSDRYIKCNWAIIDQDNNGKVSQVALIRDKRHANLKTLDPIPFADTGVMDVYISVEEPSADTPEEPGYYAAAQFEAIRGAFTVEFGVFEIIILLATGN